MCTSISLCMQCKYYILFFFFTYSDRPRIKIIHNMTSLGLWQWKVHLSCSVQCDPPANYFAWYKLEENTTVLSNNQNYTVQTQHPGTYYCDAKNEVGKSRSEPVKIYPDRMYKSILLKQIYTFFINNDSLHKKSM